MSVVPGRGEPEQIVAKGAFPSATSDGKTIVFASTEPGARAGLWRADADGRNARQLVPGRVSAPVVTMDDRQVIFHPQRNATSIVSIDGGTPTEFLHEFATGISLSADGRSMLFGSPSRNELQLVICDLPDCTTRRTVIAPAGGTQFRWAPDGRSIAYRDRTRQNLWIQPLDSGPPRQLTHFPADRFINDFAWSRDGKRLAVARSVVTSDIVLFKGLKQVGTR